MNHSVRIVTRGDNLAHFRRHFDQTHMIDVVGDELLAGVDEAFQEEGPGWAPLAESTARDRARRGYGPRHPILQRTGAYRRSWTVVKTADSVSVVSRDPKAAILSRAGRNRPARPVRIAADRVARALREGRRALGE